MHYNRENETKSGSTLSSGSLTHEELGKMLFDMSPMPLLLIDHESRRVVGANSSALRAYGYSLDELTNLNPATLFGEGQYAFFLRRLRIQDVGKMDGVWQHRRRDGSTFSVEMSVVRSSRDGRQLSLLTLFDVTHWMQLQASLDEAELNHSRIFENAVEGIYQSTRDDRFLTVNPAFARMLGYENASEMLSRIDSISKRVYVNPDVRKKILQILDREGMALDQHFEAYKSDGSKIWLSTDARAVKNSEGQTLYYEGFIKDITRERQVRENLESFANQARKLINDLLRRSEWLVGKLE
jgi:PAS domain S-box-containing protein